MAPLNATRTRSSFRSCAVETNISSATASTLNSATAPPSAAARNVRARTLSTNARSARRSTSQPPATATALDPMRYAARSRISRADGASTTRVMRSAMPTANAIAATAPASTGSAPRAAPAGDAHGAAARAATLRLKLVSDTPHRLQVPRPRRVLLDLRAQAAHVHRHRARLAGVRVVPDVRHELLAREHAARMPREVIQQVELARRQLDAPARVLDRARARVDAQVREAQRLAVSLLARARAAQHRRDARGQLARAERLRDVVVRADAEADELVHLLAAGREHDHGDGRAGAQAAADFEAIDARQHHVEHHQVRRESLERLDRGEAVADGADVVAVTAQVAFDDVGDHALVLDDEDAAAGTGRGERRRAHGIQPNGQSLRRDYGRRTEGAFPPPRKIRPNAAASSSAGRAPPGCSPAGGSAARPCPRPRAGACTR